MQTSSPPSNPHRTTNSFIFLKRTTRNQKTSKRKEKVQIPKLLLPLAPLNPVISPSPPPTSSNSKKKSSHPPIPRPSTMAEPSIYDEIELEDLTFHPSTALYTYPCPCGDQFEISLPDLRAGEDIAVCPSCSLMIRVIFEAVRSVLYMCLVEGCTC